MATHVVAVGDRVEFLGWGNPDPYSDLTPGEKGTVSLVDDFGTVHVRWDNGSRIGLVQRAMNNDPTFRADRFRVIGE